jgi:hypothetical protein
MPYSVIGSMSAKERSNDMLILANDGMRKRRFRGMIEISKLAAPFYAAATPKSTATEEKASSH